MDPTTDRRYINNGGLTIKQMVDSFNSNKNESKEFKIPSYSYLAKVMEVMKVEILDPTWRPSKALTLHEPAPENPKDQPSAQEGKIADFEDLTGKDIQNLIKDIEFYQPVAKIPGEQRRYIKWYLDKMVESYNQVWTITNFFQAFFVKNY